jgi:DNA-binding IclR family transcriptional regulator
MDVVFQRAQLKKKVPDLKHYLQRKSKMTSQRIESVAKALRILLLFEFNKSEWGVTEIARELGMQKSTVYRLLATMQELGFVRKSNDGSVYRLGLSLFELGNVVANSFDFRGTAVVYMRKLADQCGESVNLGVLNDHEVMSVEAVETQNSLKPTIMIGGQAPLYCTGIGKVLLAFLPADEREQIIKGIYFQKFTKQTIVDCKRLEEELELTRKRGYAIDKMEHEIGITCAVVGALSISGPSVRLTPERLARCSELVMTTAGQISHDLGYQPSLKIG